MTKIANVLPALLLFAALTGCGDRGQIDRYRETGTTTPAAEERMPASHPPLSGEYRWQAPEGWVAQPPSSMRMGSFLVPQGTEQGDLSVIRLAGTAGGTLNNLNRWRGQLGLEPVAAEDPAAAGRETACPAGTFTWWHLVSGEPQNQGMLVGMLPAGDHSLFVKLTGSAELVGAAEEQFIRFLESFGTAEGS